MRDADEAVRPGAARVILRGTAPLQAAEALVPAAEPGGALIGLSRTRRFIPELESLRGIAVSLVFAFHVNAYVVVFYRLQGPPTLWNSFVRAGHTGVDLFFLLSGFLLSLPFLAEGLDGKRASVSNYFMRRALRILPLYYSAVLIGTVCSGAHPGDFRHALSYFVFLNAFTGMVPELHPYGDAWWSLATEAEFYLLLPLLPLALRTRAGRMVGAAALGLYGLAYGAMVVGRLHTATIGGQLYLVNSLFGRGPLFLWGIAAAFLYHTRGARIRDALARSRWMRGGGADALLAVVVVGMAALLEWVVSIGPARGAGAADQPWHIVNGALWATVLLLLLLAPLRSKSLVCHAVLARLGVLSYSIYLLHAPFMQFSLRAARHLAPSGLVLVGWNAATVPLVAVLSLACCALASLTYRFIERPFLIRKARLD